MKILLVLLIINFIISSMDWIFLYLITKCVEQRLGINDGLEDIATNNIIAISSLFRYGIVAACPVVNILFAIMFVTGFDECVDGVYNKVKGYMKDEDRLG